MLNNIKMVSVTDNNDLALEELLKSPLTPNVGDEHDTTPFWRGEDMLKAHSFCLKQVLKKMHETEPEMMTPLRRPS